MQPSPRFSQIATARRSVLFLFAIALALLPPGTSAFAVQPDEVLKNPVLEARARALSVNLRCLVCQNQSIDDSDSGLARDLRILVRERLVAGDSDNEVMDFMVARYGEFVLLKPTWAPHTYLLWLAPLFLFAGAIFLARSAFRTGAGNKTRSSSKTSATEPLSKTEEARLKNILKPAPRDQNDTTRSANRIPKQP